MKPLWLDKALMHEQLPESGADGADFRQQLPQQAQLRPGDPVRLWPKPGGDVLDTVLRGQRATVACVEQDYEDRIHVAVTLDDDPGRDLGDAGMGHRFFFWLDEIEVLGRGEQV